MLVDVLDERVDNRDPVRVAEQLLPEALEVVAPRMWTVMMAAMMLPSALPMVQAFVAVCRRNGQRARSLRVRRPGQSRCGSTAR